MFTLPVPLCRSLVSHGVFQASPLCVIDVGASGGAEEHWSVFRDQLVVLGFEPDAAEARRLTSEAASKAGGRRYFPVALDRRSGERTLNVARYPQMSSLLPPNDVLFGRFLQRHFVERVQTVPVQVVPLDQFLAGTNPAALPTFLKVDVEGGELDVLIGAKNTLRSILGVSIEVYFQEMHQGRPLFPDIDTFLRASGFEFYDFSYLEHWVRAAALPAVIPKRQLEPNAAWRASGQLIWGQALYLRDVNSVVSQEYQRRYPQTMALEKLAALAELFGLPDVALDTVLCGRAAGVLSSEAADSYARILCRSVELQRRFHRPIRRFTRTATRATVRLLRPVVPSRLREPVKRRIGLGG